MKETLSRLAADAGEDGAVPPWVVKQFSQRLGLEAAVGQDAPRDALSVFVGQVHQLEQPERNPGMQAWTASQCPREETAAMPKGVARGLRVGCRRPCLREDRPALGMAGAGDSKT